MTPSDKCIIIIPVHNQTNNADQIVSASLSPPPPNIEVH